MFNHPFRQYPQPYKHAGSVSLEATMIIPLFLVMIVACSELLTLLRVEQKLTNLNYNILALVGDKETLGRENNIAQLPFFRDFAQTQLAQVAKGKAGLSIATYNASTKETNVILLDSQCALTQNWPDFSLGHLVEVTLCFEPTNANPIWGLWPQSRFTSSMIQEVK
ncbi:hypothetical protein NM09_09750 [Vibrio caribbeanicus]|uniref:Uncharacterized protein n=1 Tax=Vibrio caribbeanicus TaxID=701175 RepID=A0ACC4NXG4_9VIBR|nr:MULTISPECIES: hypothetical protein [Vibrio]KHD25214.1 hypothetical protein NM09_09750 [Vibrio caribbeanicus]KIE21128.1 hypothetical protein SE23_08735 [Vibrio sinaloensis]